MIKMEKEFRLFVKNLPVDASESDLRDSICKYINVKSIDLKEKNNFKGETNRFAFIQVISTDKQLQKCFRDLQNEKINGSPVHVELAKESFLDRLKREREENQTKKDKPAVRHNINRELDVQHNQTQNKRKIFSDSDLTVHEADITSTLCQRNDHEKILHGPSDKTHSLKRSRAGENHVEDSNKKIDVKKRRSSQKILIESPSDSAKVKTSVSHAPEFGQSSVIGESEKKRIDSLRQKKQAYKLQEKIIRNALMDSGKINKKIVFDDEIDHQGMDIKNQNNTVRKPMLFGSDNEDDEAFHWDEDKLEEKANLREKLIKLQTKAGNDERFKIDHRFIDDDEESLKKQMEEDEPVHGGETDEKQWQLDILGNVLGRPVTTQRSQSESIGSKKQKKVMIRYDPTATDHQDYEIKLEESENKDRGKKKKKQNLGEISQDVPIPTSNELFFDVSDKLVESLQQTEGFSLLEAFGQKNQDPEKKCDARDEVSSQKNGFQFNFSKNPFRYDSSNDETDNDEEKPTTKSGITEPDETQLKEARFFFEINDGRFQEAELFFKNQSTYGEDFKKRRRELKQIVRSKIRNNLRKKAPWGKKKIRKVQKL